MLIRLTAITLVFFACTMFAQPGLHAASAFLAALATGAIMGVFIVDARGRS